MAVHEHVMCKRCNNKQAVIKVLYEANKITVFCIKDHPTEIVVSNPAVQYRRPRRDEVPVPELADK